MSRIEEELKLERSRQTLHSHYQHYQAYIDQLDTESFTDHFGEMQGKKFKRLTPTDTRIQALFYQSISNIE